MKLLIYPLGAKTLADQIDKLKDQKSDLILK
jgi:hypothetical protein